MIVKRFNFRKKQINKKTIHFSKSMYSQCLIKRIQYYNDCPTPKNIAVGDYNKIEFSNPKST